MKFYPSACVSYCSFSSKVYFLLVYTWVVNWKVYLFLFTLWYRTFLERFHENGREEIWGSTKCNSIYKQFLWSEIGGKIAFFLLFVIVFIGVCPPCSSNLCWPFILRSFSKNVTEIETKILRLVKRFLAFLYMKFAALNQH